MKIAAIALAILSTSATAASFNCDKASTIIEHTICTTDTLNSYDSRMDGLYRQAKQIDPSIVQSQRAWMKERNKLTTVRDLEDSYLARMEVLNDLNSGALAYREKNVKAPADQPKKVQERKAAPGTPKYTLKLILDTIDERNAYPLADGTEYPSNVMDTSYPAWVQSCALKIVSNDTMASLRRSAQKEGEYTRFVNNTPKLKNGAYNATAASLYANPEKSMMACEFVQAGMGF